MLVAAAAGRVPSVRERCPDLPGRLDQVLRRGLARDREERHETTIELLWDVARVLGEPWGEDQVGIAPEAYKGAFAAPAEPEPAASRELEPAEARLMRVFESSLSAAVAVDESSFVVGWNAMATEVFGWTRDEIVGRSLSSTLIPPRYREAHERGFRRFLETGEGPVLGQVIELSALHRDGRELPIELSISPAARSGPRALFVGFARDLTARHRARDLRAAREAVAQALAGPAEEAGRAALAAIGRSLGWSAGVLWTVDEPVLRCREVWTAEGLECPDLEAAVRDARFARDVGLPGRVWRSGDGVWVEDVLHEPETRLALPALRAGLRSAAGVPVLRGAEVVGVLHLLGAEVRPPDEELLGRLFDLCRRLGPALAGPPAAEGRR
jgi:PAS domain S-box-containing protein